MDIQVCDVEQIANAKMIAFGFTTYISKTLLPVYSDAGDSEEPTVFRYSNVAAAYLYDILQPQMCFYVLIFALSVGFVL